MYIDPLAIGYCVIGLGVAIGVALGVNDSTWDPTFGEWFIAGLKGAVCGVFWPITIVAAWTRTFFL